MLMPLRQMINRIDCSFVRPKPRPSSKIDQMYGFRHHQRGQYSGVRSRGGNLSNFPRGIRDSDSDCQSHSRCHRRACHVVGNLNTHISGNQRPATDLTAYYYFSVGSQHSRQTGGGQSRRRRTRLRGHGADHERAWVASGGWPYMRPNCPCC